MTDGHDHDPVVSRALRDLPVPDHAPGFWAALDERLAADGAVDDAPVDERIHTGELPSITELHAREPVPSRQRQRFLAVAAAAAIVAVAAGVVMRGGGDDDPIPQAAATTAPAESSTTSSTSAPTSVTPPSGAPTPQDAVSQYVVALGSGDIDTARSLVGPASQRYLASLGGDLDGFLRESQEGWGAWASQADKVVTILEVPDAGSVVVLEGTPGGEGGDRYRTEALPTVERGGRWFVEPMAFSPEVGGRLEVVIPEPRPEGWGDMPPDGIIEVTSLADGTYWMSLDGAPLVPDDDGVYDPPGEMRTSTHMLVAVVVAEDVFSAVAGTFPVSE